MLQGGMMAPPTTTHYEDYLAEKQLHEQQQTHNYLKQQIRQTVLTRVGSRGQPGQQLEEAPESEESEVIDLTGKKDSSGQSEATVSFIPLLPPTPPPRDRHRRVPLEALRGPLKNPTKSPDESPISPAPD
jgi:hypothetical protein